VPCNPPEYLEKVGEEFKKAMKKEDVFTFPISFFRVLLRGGPDIYSFNKEVKLTEGGILVSDKVIVSFMEKSDDESPSP